VTDRPYTDDDLRAEAARQHYTATTDPDFMGIGEQMDGSPIESTCFDAAGERHEPGLTWDQLDGQQFGEVQRAIDDLLGKAADVSDWAVNLGADGLEPSPHEVTFDNADGAFVRLHLAFHPSMPEHDRQRFHAGIKQALRDAL
jgi:hypothetical protein